MKRDLSFRTTTREIEWALRDQLDAALQLVAALTLTDEEVIEIKTSHDPKVRPDNMRGWAREMRDELLGPAYREGLVQMFREHGFLTNSHPGFPLGGLAHPVPQGEALNECYKAIEVICATHAAGEGPDVPPEPDRHARMNTQRAWLSTQLIALGHDPVVVEWCLTREGYQLFLMACIERIVGQQVQNRSPSA